MTVKRRKFSSQVKPEILDALKSFAESEGRQFQAVLEEAMMEYLENRREGIPRDSAIAHFQTSVERNYPLSETIAEKGEAYLEKQSVFPFLKEAKEAVSKKRREAVLAQLKDFKAKLNAYKLSDPVNLIQADRDR